MGEVHQPVLYHDVLLALQPISGGRYVDGTLGAGGHAAGILLSSAPDGLLLGLDIDPMALELARQRLAPFGERACLVRASYTTLKTQMATLGWHGTDGILLDLGASSMAFDIPERGFSFQADGPLDMRFDPSNPVTAAELVNTLSESELSELIYRYGEEPAARRIAHAILRARPVTGTGMLVEIISRVSGGMHGRIHPATRTFQALRIATNQELQALEKILPLALEALEPGGRLAIISFHSLEDRLVKDFFRTESRDCICSPRHPVCVCGHKASIREVTHRPIRPEAEEVRKNPRSRSAKLRVAEKLPVLGKQ